jgi:hypothetical protein
MNLIRKTIKIILLTAIIIFIVSYFQKDRLPGKEEILPELYRAPIQTETDKEPFKIEKGGITYEITPLFDYELYGLVVSGHNSKSWLDYYHEKWEDFINLKDVCVIWGGNIESEVYQEMKFKNGSFTCYADFKSGVDRNVIYQKFKNEALSNNHLLSADGEINKKIRKARDGDQIHLKGYLVQYAHDDFQRGSSITRTDSGNGACETIYLTDFRIIKEANIFWRLVFTSVKYLIIILIIILLVLLLRGGGFKRLPEVKNFKE